MNVFTALIAGIVFGFGLIVSGMSDPAKVLAFLDIGGRWDPSLALVMFGAIGMAAPAFAVARRRSRTLLGTKMRLAERSGVDRRLLLGSALFGAGWGLAGFCPGPALVASGMGNGSALVLTLAMLVAMLAFEVFDARVRAAHGQHASGGAVVAAGDPP